MSKSVTEEQIAAAKRIGTLDYLQRFEPEELTTTYIANGRTMHCKHGEYRTRTHDSLSVNGNWFYWWSRAEGGTSALDYLVKVKEMPFPDAVRFLTGDSAQQLPHTQTIPSKPPKPEERKELRLPYENDNHRRVFAYLYKSRGIDPEIINHCLKNRTLYEDREHHNAVFIGYKGRKPVFGALRSTITDSHWRMDLSGSDKRYSFRMDNPDTTHVMVFEAAIDAMSMASLMKGQGQDWKQMSYLSLSGTAPAAILHYINEHPEITKVTVALDNDDKGRSAAEVVRQAILSEHPEVKVNVIRPSPEQGKDWNEVLLFKRQQAKSPASLQNMLSQAKAEIEQTRQQNLHPPSVKVKNQEQSL